MTSRDYTRSYLARAKAAPPVMGCKHEFIRDAVRQIKANRDEMDAPADARRMRPYIFGQEG